MKKLPLLLLATLYSAVVPAFGQEPNGEVSTIMEKCLSAAAGAKDKTAMSRACIGKAATACMEMPGGQTTVGMTKCASNERRWWEHLLEFRLGALKKQMSPDAFGPIHDAQEKWLTFKKADCVSVNSHLYESGSLRAPAIAWCLLDATALRSIRLGGLVEQSQQDSP